MDEPSSGHSTFLVMLVLGFWALLGISVLAWQDYQPPPPSGWTAEDWTILLLTMLMAERVFFWADRFGSWARGKKDPEGPVSKVEIASIVGVHEEKLARDRKESMGEMVAWLGRDRQETKNTIVMEMRPVRNDVEKVLETLQDIEKNINTRATYERLREELLNKKN